MRIFVKSLMLPILGILFVATPTNSAEETTKQYRVENIVRKHFDIIASTQTCTYEVVDNFINGDNSKLVELFEKQRLYEDEILLMTAKEQTAGIGSNSRTWQSPPGNVYATFTFPWPENQQGLLFFVPQVSNLSVCQTVTSFGLNPQFKWINDMLLNDKKSAGVLANCKGTFPYYSRSNDQPSSTNHVALVLGIGINVNMELAVAQERFESVTDVMKMPFTSMTIESGRVFDVEAVLTELNKNLCENFSVLLRDRDFASSFLPKISPMLAYVGQEVEYSEDKEEPRKVLFRGIQNDGQIILQEGDRETTKLSGRIRPIF